MNAFVSVACITALVGVGCRAGSDRAPEPASRPSDPTPPSPTVAQARAAEKPTSREKPSEPFVGTAGILDVPRQGGPSVLSAVRAASHEGYDRVVFEFKGGVPGYHVEYVDRPVRDCGAGDPKPVAGDAWLEVRFFPAFAHTEEGQPTLPFREFHPNLPNVLEVERTCDFEAVVTWVLGVRSPKHYRVLELSDPPRFVIDVRH